jgi:hypothetical protein
MTVDPTWVAAAAAITPGFETTGDPFEAAAGDFDGMGISCGALQWNIGMGSLQPMVLAVGRPVVLRTMPANGARMWEACTGTVNRGLQIVRTWQSGSTLRAGPKAELRALMGSPEMRAQQQARLDAKAEVAMGLAREWSMARDGTEPTKRLFLWFFDIVTQNGSMKGITPADVAHFIAVNRPDRVDDLVCDFLAGKKGASGHVKDAKANASLWRDPAEGETLELLCMSYLRAGKSNAKWQHVVLNRKGTIAMGRGFVNGKLWEFAGFGL